MRIRLADPRSVAMGRPRVMTDNDFLLSIDIVATLMPPVMIVEYLMGAISSGHPDGAYRFARALARRVLTDQKWREL